MKHLSHINPAKRKFPSSSGVAIATRGTTATRRADSDVAAFVWGISFFLFLFLSALGGPSAIVVAVFALPIAAITAVVFSKMARSPVWAWSIAATYCALGACSVVWVAVS